ncbi:putative sodium-dependent multivitamin transporter [Venturia canescens]|uniref:putative sodium-dependent multivitamin transporter n=1 Tax=Venturia canescens TaxID=32260 RepID=UPI001C9CA5CD|nr:putative sodium-dependent multivitamin transporter [Venturia canescens]XP_043276419.1 putative sodium-dependent multivitamin transporter [Venturia canescens]
MPTTATLGWTDYTVIGLMLGISIGIGIYYRLTGGRQRTTEEYFSANRSMSILPVGIALMVSFMSAITLLGVSAENYTYGTQFVVINFSYLLGTPIVCYGFLPVFYKLQAVSAYEYLERRFGMKTRLVASFVYWIQLLLYSGVVLYAPSLVLEATTGLSQTGSIVVIGLVCAFYSGIGGMKAVLITDVFQAFLMFLALFLVIGTAAHSAGGLGEIWHIAQKGHRIEFDNISIDPTVRHTIWNLLIGGLCTFLSLYGVNQVQIQRMLTVKSLKAARIALWLNWPILTALSITTCFSGLALYSKYSHCDPKMEGRITITDMLMPLYVMDTMSHLPGVPGLFVAGIFSAGLSTISAGLNSLAAVTLEDYVKPLYRACTGREFTVSGSLVIGKLLAFGFGILCIAVAFFAQQLGGVLQTSLTIFAIVGGPILGLFTLGMGFKSANERGAITGVLTSLVFLMWIAFAPSRPTIPTLPTTIDGCSFDHVNNSTVEIVQSTKPRVENSEIFYLYRISYMWYSPIGFIMTLVVGLIVSYFDRLVFKQDRVYLDPDLFFPIIGKRLRKDRQIDNGDNTSERNIADVRSLKKYSFEKKNFVTEMNDETVTHI